MDSNLGRKEQWLIIGAFAVVYLVWGSTYLFNYFAIQAIPPFLMVGSRFFAAGSVVFVAGLLLDRSKPTLEQWRKAMFAGFLFLSVGTGAVVWAMQYVDTGIAALMVGFQPLTVVLMMWALQSKRPGGLVWVGLVFGIAGMIVLVTQDSFATDHRTVWGIIAIAIGILSWGYGSLFIGKANLPGSKWQSVGMQMLSGGSCLLLISYLTGEFRGFHWENLTGKAAFSWFYLVVLGSVLAFSAFNYLLLKVTPDKVATSNYVHPVIALFLGWAFNHEVVTVQSILATILLITGVFFINARSSVGRPARPKWRRLKRRKVNPVY